MSVNALNYLEESACAHPESHAVIDESGAMTYAQLYDVSQRVGSALAQRDVRLCGVIVAMEKGAHALVAQLGVLYAGAYYVPVDSQIPAERLEYIVDALGEACIIADDSSYERIERMSLHAALISFSELSAHEIDFGLLTAIREKTLENDPAYALFTSGSTGVPKGVIISHRAIVSFIDSFVETVGICGTDRIGNQAPFDFDVSTKDIYSSLATSATLVVIPRRLFMEPAALAEYLEKHQVTVLIWAVAALCILSAYHVLDNADLSAIRAVLFSGETMPTKHLRNWRNHLPHATFVNLYGPTEVTCNCLYYVLDPNSDYPCGVPLGSPFEHCDVFLVDEEGHKLTEPNREGELLVRGPSLALGYLGCPEQTRTSFCQNPLNTQYPDRVYRTGDLAVLDSEGRLFFRGRKDNQVKYQGHRIELEEIDLMFERFPGVNRCRCAFDNKRKLLRAFYEGPADEGSLPALAREKLPAFMRPVSIRRVEDMPLNKNGKVDRARLLTLSRR